jgi:hypothetical protein
MFKSYEEYYQGIKELDGYKKSRKRTGIMKTPPNMDDLEFLAIIETLERDIRMFNKENRKN